MQRHSLHVRHLLVTWTALFFVLCLVFWFFIRQTERLLVEDARDLARSKLELVLWLVRDAPDRPDLPARTPGEAGPARVDLAGLADWAAAMGKHLGARVTYIADGRVLADSEVPGPDTAGLEDHAGRPEVVAALADGFGTDVRRSNTTGRQTVYTAMRAEGLPGLPDGVMRVAVPYHAVTTDLARFRGIILAALGIVLLSGGLLTLLPTRSLTGTVKEITLALTALGEGDYTRRLYLPPDKEFAGLAEAFNATAVRVGRHVASIEGRRNRHAAMLDSLDEGLAVIKPNGRISSHNTSLLRLLCASDLEGRLPIETALGPTIHGEVTAMLHDRAADRTTRRHTLPDGRDVEIRLVPFTDKAGRRRLILSLRDVTAQTRMQAGIRDFVRDASHRLRTPLTKISGYLDMAEGSLKDDPDRAGRALAAARRFVPDMETAVADLVALAAARFSRNMDRPPVADVRRILENALREAAARAPDVAPPPIEVRDPGEYPAAVEPNGLGRVFAAALSRMAASGTNAAVILFRSEKGIRIDFPGADSLLSPFGVGGDDTALVADFLAAYGGSAFSAGPGVLGLLLPPADEKSGDTAS